MPVPLTSPIQIVQPVDCTPVNIEAAIDTALVKAGALNEQQLEAREALNEMGLNIRGLSQHLGNLILTAKDPVKHRAIQDGFKLHGVDLNSKSEVDSKPTFVFNIQADNANVNSMFMPQRD